VTQLQFARIAAREVRPFRQVWIGKQVVRAVAG